MIIGFSFSVKLLFSKFSSFSILKTLNNKSKFLFFLKSIVLSLFQISFPLRLNNLPIIFASFSLSESSKIFRKFKFVRIFFSEFNLKIRELKDKWKETNNKIDEVKKKARTEKDGEKQELLVLTLQKFAAKQEMLELDIQINRLKRKML